MCYQSRFESQWGCWYQDVIRISQRPLHLLLQLSTWASDCYFLLPNTVHMHLTREYPYVFLLISPRLLVVVVSWRIPLSDLAETCHLWSRWHKIAGCILFVEQVGLMGPAANAESTILAPCHVVSNSWCHATRCKQISSIRYNAGTITGNLPVPGLQSVRLTWPVAWFCAYFTNRFLPNHHWI